jgi:hypothetical protein
MIKIKILTILFVVISLILPGFVFAQDPSERGFCECGWLDEIGPTESEELCNEACTGTEGGYIDSSGICNCQMVNRIETTREGCTNDAACEGNVGTVRFITQSQAELEEWIESGEPDRAPSAIELQPPFGQKGESGVGFIQEVIGVVINWALGIVGSIALLMFVIGGFIWLTSAGNPDKIKSGRNIIVWSVIGLAVIFASYAISRVILEALLG